MADEALTFPNLITAGVPFTFGMEATNNPTSWAADTLPAGLALDSVTGAISGVIAAPGMYSFQLTATNAGGVSAPMFVYLLVSPAPAAAPAAPVASSGPLTTLPWLDDLALIDLQFDLRLRGVTSTYTQQGGITLMQSDTCNLAVVLLTPAGQVSDAVTLWLVAKTVEDSMPVIDLTVTGSAALTAQAGGSYYLLQPNLLSVVTEAIDDLSAPAGGGPRTLALICQLAVQRGSQIARSQPFTINIIQRVAQASAPNDIP
jgi:hypothetical protein